MRWVLALVVMLQAFNGVRASRCGQLTGCVDDYWANFWLMSYFDGYSRRALAGSILHALMGTQLSYLHINLLCAIIALAGFGGAIYLALKNFGQTHRFPLVALLLATGPTFTLFIELLGDTLQLCFLLCMGCLALAGRSPKPAHGLVIVLAALAAILIHEASIFVVLPALCILALHGMGRRTGFIPVLGVMGAALLLPLLLGDDHGAHTRSVLMQRDGSVFPVMTDPLPPFATLLQTELHNYFGSPGAVAKFVMKIFQAFTWPMLVVLFLAHQLHKKAILACFLFLMAVSSPLYVIAHDWGRFAIYTLWMSIGLAATLPATMFEGLAGVGALAERMMSATERLFASAFLPAALVFVYTAYSGYRVEGLTKVNLLQIGLLVFAALAFEKLVMPMKQRVSLGQGARISRQA
jgi:hypothetical protein